MEPDDTQAPGPEAATALGGDPIDFSELANPAEEARLDAELDMRRGEITTDQGDASC